MKNFAIFLDLDGTLLTTDKRLTPRAEAALRAANEAGAYIVPTTGRLYEGMPEAVRGLEFIEYAITVNGAEVYDVKNRRALSRNEIETPRAIEIFRTLERFDGIYDCYAAGWGYMEREKYLLADEYVIDPEMRKMVKALRKPVDGLFGYVTEHFPTVQKVQMFFRSLDENRRAAEILRGELENECVTSSVRGNLEINSKNANKGAGLRFLADYLGIPMENTIAFGDGSNDAAMIEAAGTGIAMENATKELKAMADRVIGRNDEDGVAQELERIVNS